MKTLLRYYLINLGALWFTSHVVPGFIFDGGTLTLLKAAVIFTLINLLLVPVLKVLLLPLNLLTLGLFSWVINVLALYALVRLVPNLHLTPFYFSGFNLGGFIIPSMDLSAFWVAMLAALVIGIITHFFHWLASSH